MAGQRGYWNPTEQLHRYDLLPCLVDLLLRLAIVDFDTGSSFFVLPGPKCAASCLGHNIYDPRASNTSRDKGWRFSRGVGSQGASVDGEVYDDTLSIAGLVAMNQSLVVASHYSAQLAKSNFPSDGILGLAFEALSENVRPPVFQSLVEQGQTDRPVFGVTLLDGGGELFLGGTDTTAFDGPLTFADLVVKDPPGFWEISVDAVKVGNATVVSQPHNAIVDTGAPLFLVDMDTVNTIYGAIEGSLVATALAGPGTWTVPCDNVPTDISIVIGGKAFALSPETINTGPLRKGSNRCLGGIVGQAQNRTLSASRSVVPKLFSDMHHPQNLGSSATFSCATFTAVRVVTQTLLLSPLC